MDDASVQEAAERHAQATVDKDFKTAGSVLTETAMGQARDVMAKMPEGLNSFQIDDVTVAGQEYIAAIRYVGASGETVVQSRWAEIDGHPMITDLKVE